MMISAKTVLRQKHPGTSPFKNASLLAARAEKPVNKKIASTSPPLLAERPLLIPLLATLSGCLASKTLKGFLRRHHCSMTEWRVMLSIYSLRDATATDICAHSGMDKGGVSRALKILAKRGILSVFHASENGRGRGSRISLSQAGAALHAEIAADEHCQEKTLLSGISAIDRAMLFATLTKIAANVSRGGQKTMRATRRASMPY